MKAFRRIGSVGGALVALMAASPSLAAGPACLNLPAAKVAFQLYSVNRIIGGPRPPPAPGQPFARPTASPTELDAAFAQLKAQGWRNMENFAGSWGLSTPDYAAAVKKSGLQAVSSHDDLDPKTWDAVLDRAKALGQTYVGSGGFGGPGIDTLENTLQTAANLEALGEAAAKKGLKFFVHSHQNEIKNQFEADLNGDGRKEMANVIDIIAARTDPRYVNFEVDIGWAAAAFNLDQEATAAFLRKHADRLVLVHVKDMTPQSRPTDMGAGVLDYSKLLAAAGPKVGYYVWEYDGPPNPLESSKIAYAYMTCSKN